MSAHELSAAMTNGDIGLYHYLRSRTTVEIYDDINALMKRPRSDELRDKFAAAAMQSILYETIKIEGDATTHRVARDAYRIADAMLKQRES